MGYFCSKAVGNISEKQVIEWTKGTSAQKPVEPGSGELAEQQKQTVISPGAGDVAASASSRVDASISYIEAVLMQRAETLDEAEAA